MTISGRWWKLALGGAFFVIVVCGAALVLLPREQARLQNPEIAQRLLTEGRLLAAALQEHWPVGDGPVPEMVRVLRADGAQVIIAAGDGRIHVNTTDDRTANEALAAPESQQARLCGAASGVRRWGPDRSLHVVTAARIGPPEAPLGVLWLARPAWGVKSYIPRESARLLGIIAAVTVTATLGLIVVAVRLRRRMFHRLLRAVRNLSSGDLSVAVPVPGDEELAALASTFEVVRARMTEQVGLIDRQRVMLQTLINQLQEGVIVARSDGRLALINPTAVALLDLPLGPGGCDALLGRPIEACIPPHALQQMLLGIEPKVRPVDEHSRFFGELSGLRTRLEIQTPRGTRHVVARAAVLDLAEHVPEGDSFGPGRVVMLTDITELHRLMQMKTDFVANASHELRTPLSTIRAAVETLLAMDMEKERPAAMQFLAKVDRQSARLQQMVADLLDLSRLESPTARFVPEVLEVRRVMHDLQARFSDALERKQLHWDARVRPPELIAFSACPHLLRLVLDNLVDNAIKFTERGGHITIGLTCTGAELTLTVADDGCGIPVEDQQRVFERFYQVQRSRSGSERGTGLGLSIVRHAVGAMHGTVQLESAPDHGTTVRVLIPQTADAERPRAEK